MTIHDFRKRLKELHPDTNGGDESRVVELSVLIEGWRADNEVCRCGCGRKISRCQLQRRRWSRQSGKGSNRALYATMACYHRIRRLKFGRRLATAILFAVAFKVLAGAPVIPKAPPMPNLTNFVVAVADKHTNGSRPIFSGPSNEVEFTNRSGMELQFGPSVGASGYFILSGNASGHYTRTNYIGSNVNTVWPIPAWPIVTQLIFGNAVVNTFTGAAPENLFFRVDYFTTNATTSATGEWVMVSEGPDVAGITYSASPDQSYWRVTTTTTNYTYLYGVTNFYLSDGIAGESGKYTLKLAAPTDWNNGICSWTNSSTNVLWFNSAAGLAAAGGPPAVTLESPNANILYLGFYSPTDSFSIVQDNPMAQIGGASGSANLFPQTNSIATNYYYGYTATIPAKNVFGTLSCDGSGLTNLNAARPTLIPLGLNVWEVDVTNAVGPHGYTNFYGNGILTNRVPW